MRRSFHLSERLCSEATLRSNWLDWFRLGLALLVIFSHSFPLTRGSNATEPLSVFTHGQLNFGVAAVEFFFLISGFLIVRSWLQSRSMQDYFRKRVLRIYPGYTLALLGSLALALLACSSTAVFFHEFPKRRFLLSFLDLEYGALDMPKNSFPGNPYFAVNGALWTIQLEFIAYIGIAVYGLFGLFRHRMLWLGLTFSLLAYCIAMTLLGRETPPLLAFGSFFASGATFYLFRDLVPRSRGIFIASLIVLSLSTIAPPWFKIAWQIASPYAVFYIALRPIPDWAGWTKHMDLSYGAYLYGFVIQQSLVYWLHLRNPVSLFAVAAPVALLCAVASWFAVEKPCIELKSREFKDWDVAGGGRLPAPVPLDV